MSTTDTDAFRTGENPEPEQYERNGQPEEDERPEQYEHAAESAESEEFPAFDERELAGVGMQVEPEGVARPENLGGHDVGAGGESLIDEAEREEFLSRWSQIRLSFVADPPTAVESAEVLMRDIGAAMTAAFQDRSNEFAGVGRAASDTEQQRLALRRYHAFIGVILPE